MYSMLLNSGIAKYAVIVAIIGAVSLSIYFKISGLESEIIELEKNITDLTEKNFVLSKANKDNITTLTEYKKDLNNITEINSMISENKEEEITKLKRIIAEQRKPIIYPKETIYKECKIKIKTEDLDENSSFNVINTIGF